MLGLDDDRLQFAGHFLDRPLIRMNTAILGFVQLVRRVPTAAPTAASWAIRRGLGAEIAGGRRETRESACLQ